jgi:2-polyprenyl-3-methyl-5-hydroxy-6-metoxy-1,4-benzoquinol methylase
MSAPLGTDDRSLSRGCDDLATFARWQGTRADCQATPTNHLQMNTIWENEGIKVQNVSACYLCKTEGRLLYGGLRDRLFKAPGEWNFRQCPAVKCGLVWLDPMPTEADIPKLYSTYYTHQVGAGRNGSMGFRTILSSKFRAARKRVYYLLLHLTSLRRERFNLRTMYLANNKPGTLLEVGCGNGAFLALMRSRSWQVQGVEVDPAAAKIAEETFGVHVFVGILEEANYSNGSFDALTMNHVIEHVNDPIGLLKGCHRVLKPGGKLIMVTPNINGIGHRRFRQDWRDLDPPRHLHLFSQSSLENIARQANFNAVETWTTPANAEVMALGSTAIQRGERLDMAAVPRLSTELLSEWLQLRALAHYRRDSNSGDEVILRAYK